MNVLIREKTEDRFEECFQEIRKRLVSKNNHTVDKLGIKPKQNYYQELKES